jgi:hypothetical protein
MTNLLELADRVERLTGPCRETDAAIWCALNGKKYKGHFPVYGEPSKTRVEYTDPPKRTRLVSGPHVGGDALQYTASIDAAMTLVPPGWAGSIWLHGPCELRHPAKCRLDQMGRAKTPALSVIAAALRARHYAENKS